MQVDDNLDSERTPLTKGAPPSNQLINTKENISETSGAHAQKRKKYIKWGIIGALILIALILVIVLPIVLTKKGGNDDNGGKIPQPPLDKLNPYSVDKNKVKTNQVYLTGILKVSGGSSTPDENLANSIDDKSTNFDRFRTAFFNKDHLDQMLGLNSKTEQEKVEEIAHAPHLQAAPTPTGKNITIDWTSSLKVDKNNQFAFNLNFTFDMLDYQIARFTLTDNDNTRFSIPDNILRKPSTSETMRLEMLGFEYSLDPFSFSFHDVMDPTNVYLDTSKQTLVFMDKYIQMDFKLPSQRIYGLGERVHEFNLTEGTWTMWSSGQMSPYDDGLGRKGTYGVHPFVLVQSGKRTDDYFGIYFRNANAQSPVIKFNDDGTSTLSYITIGGQIEAYFFIHGSAKQVIAQYHSIIGKPTLPPFWSMGWQQASWKYTTQDLAQAALDGYAKAGMPLDALYLDIPYMNNYQDFSVNTTAFPNMTNFTTKLHANNQKLVVIVDAAISAEDTNNKYYKMGNADGIFIQSAIHSSDKYGKNLVSQVWPKTAVFIDWLHPKSNNTWTTGLQDLYKQVNFDGLWLDMNEPSTFVDGELDPSKIKATTEQLVMKRRQLRSDEAATPNTTNTTDWFYGLNGKINNAFDTYNLPFIVRNSENDIGNWDNATLSLNATHPGLNNEKEYNLHSLYGHLMASASYNSMTLLQKDLRPFLLTRSTFASSGRYTSHWLGDNFRDWKYMRYSISGIMNMNMFGIPHTGADVCGFFGQKKDDEMCLRWIQLSTFYPMARAHQNLSYHGNDSDPTEPFNLDGKYKIDALASLQDRYSWLRMMYTCLFEVSKNGGTCFDPLFYHFPYDKETHNDIEGSFMVANNLKVSPILDKLQANQTTFQTYFPQGKWVNMAELNETIDNTKGGAYVNLTVKQTVNVHLKSGGLVPYQDTGASILTTSDLLKEPIAIIANRDASGHAEGTLFLDQGATLSELSNYKHEYYSIKLQAKSFQFNLLEGTRGFQPHTLSELLIVDAADLSETNFACGMDKTMSNTIPMTFKWIGAKNMLKISPDTDQPVKFGDLTNVYFGNTATGDQNLCDPLTFQWKLKDPLPSLAVSSLTLTLTNLANTSPDMNITVQFIDQNIINLKWTYASATTPAGKRTPVEVPQELVDTSVRGTPSQKLSDFIQILDNPFQVQFKSRNLQDKTPYFTLNGLQIDSYLNWINAQVSVPSGDNFRGIFGLGERAYKNFFYEDGVYSIWGKDQGTPDEDGKPPAKSMYGTHPFFMFRHAAQSYAGVFYKLAHAQDWYIQNDKPNGLINLKTIATGGLGDIYIMTDQQKPQTIIERYYSIVGDPVLVPQWALGWNQCKWGYRQVSDIQDSVANYKKYGIPLDVQWSDIDYLDKYRDFTFDQDLFKGLPQLVDSLHKTNQRFVPILDIGVAMRPGQNYAAYDQGIKDDVFIKITGTNGSEPFIGKVWPNEAHYPDFFNPKTTPWWQAQLSTLSQSVNFDGLWLDMNEVSNFCDGVCYERQRPAVQVKNLLPYTPTGEDLEGHTAALDAVHANGYLQLDTHSYSGTQEVKATHEWFRDVKKQRTFIIERSSFAGMGKFGSRWLGDNSASDSQMGYSVTGIMLMNMFGIQLSGVDICGFGGNTTAELCARWHVLGSFYPFSRNHNAFGSKPQEPWFFQEEYKAGITYMDIMRDAIFNKYSMIRYFYTQMFLASWGTSQNYRVSFYKPLFFEFPEDPMAYNNLQYNVMLGDSLKLGVNSDKLGQNFTNYYFPAGTWCNLGNPSKPCLNFTTGQYVNTSSLAYEFSLYLREGYLIPHQDAKALKAMTTVDLQNAPVDFHILGSKVSADSNNWRASGVYVNDDGLSLDVTGKWNRYDISVTGQFSNAQDKITIRFTQSVAATTFSKTEPTCNAINQNDYLGHIYIYNADSFKKSTTYTVQGVTTAGPVIKLGTAVYDKPTNRIVFSRDDKVNVCLSTYPTLEFIPKV